MQNTYSLLVRSEEKGRSIMEAVLCAVVLASSIVSFGQFTAQSMVGLSEAAPAALVAKAQTQSPVARG